MMPLVGFAPDTPPTADGVLTDCVNLVPFEAGFQGSPAPVAVNAPALASDCRGAVVATKLDGSRRIFAGTVGNLYELTGSTWADRTRALATLATPGAATGTGSATGGTLAAATYYVKIVAVDSSGNNTAAGAESVGVAVTGATSSIAYTWTAVAGAASYRIYYGTAAGAESGYYTSTGASFTLTATAGTAGTPPATSFQAYTGGTDTRWSYCQFGDTTIAANLSDTIQSSSTGVFSDIATAPKAKIVVSATNNFVIAFNTIDTTYGVSPDRWWCCAQNDQTSWTPKVSTSANTGRLVAVEGAIQAALPLGNYVIAYKARGIFLGSYVGAPSVWDWMLVPGGEAGAVGQDAVCDIGGAHFIVGNDNFWLFDGTRPIPLGVGVVRQWFLKNSNPAYRYRTKATYDRQTSLVSVYYPSLTSSGACDSRLVFHVGTKMWGRADAVTQAPLNFIAPGVTINSLDALYPTINAIPNIPFGSQYWASGGQAAAYFNASNALVSLTGASANSSFTTGDLGDDDGVGMVDRLRVRFTSKPATATATGYFKFAEGDDLQQGAMSPFADGKFDLRQSGRFHRFRVDMTGDVKVTGYAVKLLPAGAR